MRFRSLVPVVGSLCVAGLAVAQTTPTMPAITWPMTPESVVSSVSTFTVDGLIKISPWILGIGMIVAIIRRLSRSARGAVR